jgi:hypothetical protein
VAEVILECTADVNLAFQNGGAEVIVHQADYEASVCFNGLYQAVLWGSEIGASSLLGSFGYCFNPVHKSQHCEFGIAIGDMRWIPARPYVQAWYVVISDNGAKRCGARVSQYCSRTWHMNRKIACLTIDFGRVD